MCPHDRRKDRCNRERKTCVHNASHTSQKNTNTSEGVEVNVTSEVIKKYKSWSFLSASHRCDCVFSSLGVLVRYTVVSTCPFAIFWGVTLIEETTQCGRFFLVLRLTNNSKQICCTALRIQKEFFTTPFLIPTSQCDFTAGRRRGVEDTESRRPGFMCSCSCRAPHLQDKYWGADRRSYE